MPAPFSTRSGVFGAICTLSSSLTPATSPASATDATATPITAAASVLIASAPLLTARQVRRGQAFDRHVHARRTPRGHGAIERAGEIRGARHTLAVAAERGGDEIVARREQLAADCPLRSIGLELDLVFGVPAGIVPDDGDEGRPAPHGRVVFAHVEAERAVARHRHDRR